jgi:hypothetical protein
VGKHIEQTNGISIEVNWGIGGLVDDLQYNELKTLATVAELAGLTSYQLTVAAGVYTIAIAASSGRSMAHQFKYMPETWITGISVGGWWSQGDLAKARELNEWMIRNSQDYDVTIVNIGWS